MEVIKWLSSEEAEDKEEACGGMGGWVDGDNWEEYVKHLPHEELVYYEALRAKILTDGLKCGGDDHQTDYIPLFSDGKIAGFSFRAWGDLLAAIYNTEENTEKYGYMDFYMSCLIETNKPKTNEDETI